jgi:signal transduction histidine kinase
MAGTLASRVRRRHAPSQTGLDGVAAPEAQPHGRRPLPEFVVSLAAGVAAFAATALVATAARSRVPEALFAALLLAVVVILARGAGILFALPVGVAAVLAFDWYLLPPLRILDRNTVLVLGTFLITSVIVAVATTQATRRAISSERARGALAAEQGALRRVATLVARQARPDEVFAAVTAEVGQVLSADFTTMSRYDADGGATVVGLWTSTDVPSPIPVGDRLSLGGRNVTTLVFQTSRPARLDYSVDASGQVAEAAREWGYNTAVGVPIDVEGRLWGVVTVGSTKERSLPADTETRLAGFTELVATAIANAEAQSALTASRARIVAAADTARRRIERDLHDAAQQRLVSLALHLRSTVQAAVPPGADELTAQLDGVAAEIVGVVDELRELARGVHPAVLANGGLRPALKTLARRSAVPVRLDLDLDGRLPEPIELAAYYVAAETLTNAVKHANATVIDVQAVAGEGVLRVRVRDDGHGGADPSGGSGLIGLTDRVEALGGRLTFSSPPGAGTTVQAVLPLTIPNRPRLSD